MVCSMTRSEVTVTSPLVGNMAIFKSYLLCYLQLELTVDLILKLGHSIMQVDSAFHPFEVDKLSSKL